MNTPHYYRCDCCGRTEKFRFDFHARNGVKTAKSIDDICKHAENSIRFHHGEPNPMAVTLYNGGNHGGNGLPFSRRRTRLQTTLRLLGFDDITAHRIYKLPPEQLEEVVKKKYDEQARQYHPDKHPENPARYTELFKAITFAYFRFKELFPKHYARNYDDLMRYATVRF